MKKLLTMMLCLPFVGAMAQTTAKIEDLAAPVSPAFVLTDLTPSLVQTPGTPKAFVFGVAQSFQPSSGSFPNNYAAEFTPHWWAAPGSISVYNVAGINQDTKKENIFSGLKFTSLSVAFINKDLIPDAATDQQKVFSFGARTTVIKVHRNGYGEDMSKMLVEWQKAAQAEFDSNSAIQTTITIHPEQAADLLKKWKDLGTGAVMQKINALINEKPLFNWDFAAASAVYGINDQEYKSGRTGVWTTLSTYLPLALEKTDPKTNYFNLNMMFRYQADNFYKNDAGIIGLNNSVDFGGKAALEFNTVSIGVESLYRFNNKQASDKNRTVGVINIKVADDIILNGSFGKNFDAPDKLITAFGINWGIGKEKVALPNQ